MESSCRPLSPYVSAALYFGLFVLVAAYFLSPRSSAYHTQVYLGLYIPAVIALAYYARPLLHDLRTDSTLQLFTVLLVWFGITSLWTEYRASIHLLKLLGMIWVLVLSVRIMLDNPRRLSIVLGLALSVGAVIVLATMIEYILAKGTGVFYWRLDHLGARAIPSVTLGKLSGVIVLVSFLQMCRAQSTWLKMGTAATALIFLFPFVFSFSRTAFLALTLTAFWYFLQQKNMRLAALIGGLSLGLFVVAMMNINIDWLMTFSRSSSFEIRLWGWQATLREISVHPLIGHGLRSPFDINWSGTPYAGTNTPFHHAHNLFLGIWYDAGMIGLVLFLALLVLIARKVSSAFQVREARHWSYVLIYVLLVCLVDGPSMIDRPNADWIWFWLPLAVTINIDKFVSETSPPTTSLD